MIEIKDISIDEDELKSLISEAKDLNDHEEMFNKLSEISVLKKEIADALEIVEGVEREAKYTIDDRARELYGNDWQAISGKGYKISRSRTGSVYTILPDIKPQKKFLVIKESINTKAVDAEIEEKGKLPKGVEYNPSRGTMIRITLR